MLIDITTGDAVAKRRLRLELAGAVSPADVAREVRKRLTTLARSNSFVDWLRRGALADDLAAQHRAIVTHVAAHDPDEALALMWRFIALANSLFERCDDSGGMLSQIFYAALEDLGELAGKAQIDAEALADAAFEALTANHYGQYDSLIGVLAPALGADGLAHLKQRMIERSNTPVRKPADSERQIIGYGSSRSIYADEMARRRRESTVRLALMKIADQQGDVDAFIDQYDKETQDVACNHTSFLTTLDFLVSWPDLDRAAGLVLQRADELDGSAYYILSPAAEALAGRHPLATTLLLRSMIDFALSKMRTTRYKHAARHLHECGVLATGIEDYGVFETHAAYEAELLRAHGKKISFWSNIA